MLRYMDKPPCFSCFFFFFCFFCFFAIFTKGNNFCDFLFASLGKQSPSKMGLTLKKRICSHVSKFLGKNLSFNAGPLLTWETRMKREQLIPLKVYTFILVLRYYFLIFHKIKCCDYPLEMPCCNPSIELP